MSDLLDPDAVVNEIGAHLKSLGWTWSRQRSGLGWSKKRLGTHRKKKVVLTVRVGVKGRRNDWAKGELSVQLYNATIADGVKWGFKDGWKLCPYQRLAYGLTREFPNGRTCVLETTFTGGIRPMTLDTVRQWIDAKTAEWVDAGSGLAMQVEFIHEECFKRPIERCLELS